MRSLILLISVWVIAGCTAISYNSLTVDSASPPEAGKNMRKCPAKLEKEAECTARIYADQWTSPTGIQVGAVNEAYCIAVLPNQVWFDADRRNTPPLGERGSWLMNVFEKRHPKSGYFALMVAVLPEPADRATEDAQPVADLLRGRYTPNFKGSLVLYPNDAIGSPGDSDYYYKNNSGHIWVSIRRCPAEAQ